MKIERNWNHDELTEVLTEAVFSALHHDEDFKSVEVKGVEVFTKADMPLGFDGGGVRVRVGVRRFELRLVEVL